MADRIDDILAYFDRAAEQFFSREELRTRLKSSKKMRVKFGIDVTGPMLHIGHAVNLWLLRYLQDRGHKAVLVIGDFTTRIGDPGSRDAARPPPSAAEIEKTAAIFIEQAKDILRFDLPSLIEVCSNSEWFDKMTVPEFMKLIENVTESQLISREAFQEKIAGDEDVFMNEMLYPVLQGYDSVAVKADLAIAGADQLFNENMGRFLQEKAGQKPQLVVTTKITPGIDGRSKQSKSIGNYIGLGHSAREKFGRVMTLPDDLIDEYFRIYTDVSIEDIEKMSGMIRNHPRDAKINLAAAIVARYHGEKVSDWEKEWFDNTAAQDILPPPDMPTLPVVSPRMILIDLVALARSGKDKSELRRLITQGAVELNSQKRTDPDEELDLQTNDVLRIGKRGWYRIEVLQLHEIETDRLWLKLLEIEDVDMLQKYLPEWEIVKYLTRPVSSKMAGQVAREVFKRIIFQPEPKNEWLWKIIPKQEPDKIVGVAHLRTDSARGNENIWLDRDYRNEGLMEEAMVAINEHAFNALGFNRIVVQDAFAHAAAPKEMEVLQKRFMNANAAIRERETPDGNWGFTKEGWEKMRVWWMKKRPKRPKNQQQQQTPPQKPPGGTA